MKRKLLCLVMAAVLVLSLAACGQESKKAEGDTGETKKTLSVAMECGYAPYNWTQTDNSNGAVHIKDSSDYAYGYDVIIAKKIAEKLGYDLQIVKLDWESLVPAVQSGTVDCVIAGQSITSDRLEMVDFTEPYFYASIVTLVKKDGKFADAKGISDLAGATGTSQRGTIWYENCLPQIKDVKQIAAADDAPAMLEALASDRIDIVVTDVPTAKAALVTHPDFKVLDFTDSDDNYQVSEEDVNIGISVQKGNKELVDQINSVLSEMTPDDYNSLMDDAIKVMPLSE